MNKQQALEKIEELKKYVSECEQKEVKKVKIQIKNRFTGSIIFESEKETIKEAVIEAKNSGANLRGADLRVTNLRGADLRGADLSGANLRVTNLRGADLSGAELNSAKFYGKTSFPKTLTKKQLPDFLGALGFKIE
jgi:uncharacterized protein YjbI with pentapeptide repeats